MKTKKKTNHIVKRQLDIIEHQKSAHNDNDGGGDGEPWLMETSNNNFRQFWHVRIMNEDEDLWWN